MTKQEALEWMDGYRSSRNFTLRDPFDTYELRVAQTDAAYIQQAYWVLKAHSEDLINQRIGFMPSPIKIEQGGKIKIMPSKPQKEKIKGIMRGEK